jgi:processive 1,2-diacylglycerol beta-glucosyltransferase
MKKVLILTASFGEGHNTAARSTREALDLLDEDVAVEVLDLFAMSYGRLNTLVQKMHLQIVQRTPRLWAGVYRLLDNAPSLDGKLGIISKLKGALQDIVDEYGPDVIVSTYPVYAHVIQELYQDHAERPFRLITVVTDSISVNSFWYRAPSDLFCVANEATAAVLREGGVPEASLRVTGFPVSPQFMEAGLPELESPSGQVPAKILYIINSGKRKAGALLDRLLEVPNLELTITTGKDPGLKAKVIEWTAEAGGRVKVLGWTNQMPQLMRSHHLAIGKAGGAMVQECIAARCPLLVNQIIPGQEEGNAELIDRLGLGAVADDAREVVRRLQQALADDASEWRTWRGNLAAVARPDAAFRIAELIIETAENSNQSPDRHPLFRARHRVPSAPSRASHAPPAQSRMLLCDFHMHSNYSDGRLTVPELIDFYGQRDFDCICITDHLADPGRVIGKLARLTNLTLSPVQLEEYFEVIERERQRALRRYGMLVLTGIEFNKDGLTRKSSAHLLGIDLKQPIDPRLDLTATIEEIHRQGGIAVASHPHIMKSEWGKNTLYLWLNQDQYAPIIDAWEIANRNNIFTPIGLKHLPFIANSDFHKPKHIYSWKTLLHCAKDPEAIKQCIRTNKEVAITLFRQEHHERALGRAFRETEDAAWPLPALAALPMR